LDGGNGCVCILETMGAGAQNTAMIWLEASKISLQIRTTEFTNPTGLQSVVVAKVEGEKPASKPKALLFAMSAKLSGVGQH
jgi:hypothetical protein